MFRPVILGIAFSLSVVFSVQCARIGIPSGGSKDTAPPRFLYADPPNYTTHFDHDEVYIYFDEYITLDRKARSIVVSPFLEKVFIRPKTVARDHVYISFDEVRLDSATTYTFNFGSALKDFNEGNPLKGFRYVFSTGDRIDSLEIKIKARSLLESTPIKDVVVMLYDPDSTFNDSTIYKQAPKFIAYGTENTDTAVIRNVKAGEYVLMALEDKNGNLKFDPASERLAFLNESVRLPDTAGVPHTLNLFRESLPFRINAPDAKVKGQIHFRFDGKPKELQFTPLFSRSDSLAEFTYLSRDRDTVSYWYEYLKTEDAEDAEASEFDFEISYFEYCDTLQVSVRNSKPKAFKIAPLSKDLLPESPLHIQSNIPLLCLDTNLIRVQRQSDSAYVACRSRLSDDKANLYVDFPNPKLEKPERFLLSLLPGAVENVFRENHDTLMFAFSTVDAKKFATLQVSLPDRKDDPFFMELLDKNYTVKQRMYISDAEVFVAAFDYVSPGEYFLRTRYDTNANGVWDTGNYLEHRQPEPVYYYPEPIKLKANWDMDVSWDISIPSVLKIQAKKKKK